MPAFAIAPPIEPMLAKLTDDLPPVRFSTNLSGRVRAIVFRSGSDVFIQSRDLRPLDRYFPELHDAFLETLPDGCVVDGEIVIATRHGLDFRRAAASTASGRLSRAKLAKETPAAFVAFDLLAIDGRDLRAVPQDERRAELERAFAAMTPPIHVTPMTRDRAVAVEWLSRFEAPDSTA